MYMYSNQFLKYVFFVIDLISKRIGISNTFNFFAFYLKNCFISHNDSKNMESAAKIFEVSILFMCLSLCVCMCSLMYVTH